jgi:DHA1 family multidrug resistance protein-like MFS transporter
VQWLYRPILALFIKSMAPDSNNIAFLAGMIAAVPGFPR